MGKVIVEFENVTKTFKMISKKMSAEAKLRSFFSIRNNQYHAALRNVSFTAEEGEVIGLIGVNGSGKSTISNLISEVTLPTTGDIHVNGKVSLIAIGAGLDTELTGIQNIELKGLMMGLDMSKIREITPEIIEFSELGDFIFQPVKTYSSGMRSRLGFAISINVDPDIIVIDEALSVGDDAFSQKCINRMREFQTQNKTMFFVSHAIRQIREFCDRVIWLQAGEIVEDGPVSEVCDHYQIYMQKIKKMNSNQRNDLNKEVAAKRKLTGEEYMKLEGMHKSDRSVVSILIMLAIFIYSAIMLYTKQIL